MGSVSQRTTPTQPNLAPTRTLHWLWEDQAWTRTLVSIETEDGECAIVRRHKQLGWLWGAKCTDKGQGSSQFQWLTSCKTPLASIYVELSEWAQWKFWKKSWRWYLWCQGSLWITQSFWPRICEVLRNNQHFLLRKWKRERRENVCVFTCLWAWATLVVFQIHCTMPKPSCCFGSVVGYMYTQHCIIVRQRLMKTTMRAGWVISLLPVLSNGARCPLKDS